MDKMNINNLTYFEILVFLRGNRNILVNKLSTRKEVEKNFGREFSEDEWMDFSIFTEIFLADISEKLVIKILEEFKSTNS